MADDDRPEYKVYRSRPKLLRRDDPADNGLGGVANGTPDYEVHGRKRRFSWLRRGGGTKTKRRISPGRVLKWVLVAVGAWLLLSLVLFLISAQVQSTHISSAAKDQLTGGGFPLTSPTTILVLGSDARTPGTKEPGATTIGSGPSRSDSILLMRVGGGKNSTLSVLRDTVVPIPGHGTNKINAAYAFGGAALSIKTVEQYLGIPINHVVEVNFENFPQLIDALGGIDISTKCVHSEISGGKKNGGYTLRLSSGTHHINGKQALILARTRHNLCRPQEDDRDRAKRQQAILGGIKSQVVSPGTFFRLPWVSWAAPKAVDTDMSGPTLLGLVGAELLSGNSKRQVLMPDGNVTLPDGGAGLTVSDATKRATVAKFMAG
jgi:LCP family protein required for cell wall assembly